MEILIKVTLNATAREGFSYFKDQLIMWGYFIIRQFQISSHLPAFAFKVNMNAMIYDVHRLKLTC